MGKDLNPKPPEYIVVTHSVATFGTAIMFSIMQNNNFKLKLKPVYYPK